MRRFSLSSASDSAGVVRDNGVVLRASGNRIWVCPPPPTRPAQLRPPATATSVNAFPPPTSECFPPNHVSDGDVLSGTTSSVVHHAGVLEGWFGVHWWAIWAIKIKKKRKEAYVEMRIILINKDWKFQPPYAGAQKTKLLVDSIQDRSTNQKIRRCGLKFAVAGIPKTIDNYIPVFDKSFGFDTTVEEAQRAIIAAHVESDSSENGFGLVKLMGHYSAEMDVDYCLIPEWPFYLKGPGGPFDYIEKRLKGKQTYGYYHSRRCGTTKGVGGIEYA
ncbi:hypothetical protein RHMOL_Rhmol12G0215900 [Rhododendron molle]|uniref:Uncharacterized protein n=1 Tax=Rhododendron molle TaxID=49168 RepID=A0ACC0LKP7_RHOML|nr:hypothetical protein RHMOL_Rhmol12G0215900 [Rhododendron molle]